jgi:hypothetical protein
VYYISNSFSLIGGERGSEIMDFSDFYRDQILLQKANVSGAEIE